ncbi:MAG: alpha-L-fucosidase, partial [Verrucomicrobia bacterium]|nr:alpha-L-fucosidase [Verrucomicrobiota bacterium]
MMKGLILTTKHHDVFCLWPSKHTDHSVRSSKWMGGKGDVVKAVAEACREQGLKFGVYLSPWDRNHPEYGRPAYLAYYRNQLRELLTQYGPIFEVWFDGANGGSGYYGGARETRRIDRRTYYDWPNTWKIVRRLQPQAVMFSDAGPDVRWVGNERGVAFETSWLTVNRKGLYPGHPDYARKYAQGDPDGEDWRPPEVDVSIRPGWFYHPSQDAKVKTVKQLLDIYYQSVGRSANLLLNVPPDRRGLIHEIDARRLREFRRVLDETFRTDLARGAETAASNVRGGAERFSPAQAVDGRFETYWAADDGVRTGWIEADLGKPTRFDRVLIQEYIPLGQRVHAWQVDGWIGGKWRRLCGGTTVGYKRIARIEPVSCRRVRLRILKAKACPTISTFALYLSPEHR